MVQTAPPLEGALLPSFTLPRADGGQPVRVRAYRGRRNLALWFLHDAACDRCREMISAIMARYDEYALADTVPLVLVPGPLAEAEALRRELALPFPVLADESGSVFARYGVTGAAALLLTDRFGVPVLWRDAGPGHDLPDQDVILREAEYLAHVCGAGCATPIWPAE